MKISAYLIAAAVSAFALTGISTADAQMRATERLTTPDVQLVQKKEGGRHMLNGQRGVKERRKGYRRHSDGYWYPPAAFAAKASAKNRPHDSRKIPKLQRP